LSWEPETSCRPIQAIQNCWVCALKKHYRTPFLCFELAVANRKITSIQQRNISFSCLSLMSLRLSSTSSGTSFTIRAVHFLTVNILFFTICYPKTSKYRCLYPNIRLPKDRKNDLLLHCRSPRFYFLLLSFLRLGCWFTISWIIAAGASQTSVSSQWDRERYLSVTLLPFSIVFLV